MSAPRLVAIHPDNTIAAKVPGIDRLLASTCKAFLAGGWPNRLAVVDATLVRLDDRLRGAGPGFRLAAFLEARMHVTAQLEALNGRRIECVEAAVLYYVSLRGPWRLAAAEYFRSLDPATVDTWEIPLGILAALDASSPEPVS